MTSYFINMEKNVTGKEPTLFYEEQLWKEGFNTILGMDEAGRGAWAGCVAVGAVILPQRDDLREKLSGVKDSKQMTAQQRSIWAIRIKQVAILWSVGWASEKEIDLYGINAAVSLAALRALVSLSALPDYLLLDYFRLPYLKVPQMSLVKGDRVSLTIASASILAKTWRDEMMDQLAKEYPQYGFGRNKGYGTKHHRAALLCYGASEIHRMSYSPLRGMVNSP